MHGNKLASPLSRKATLCSLNISQWSGRKLDRKVTDEVNRSHKAKADAGRFNKLLVKKERLDPVTEKVTALRDLFYTYTKPWGQDGQGILPNAVYIEFTNKLRELTSDFNQAADVFARGFRGYVQERITELGDMFRPEDYPSEAEIREKFKVTVRFANLPDAEDFRSDVLDPATVEDIRNEIAETMQTVERDVMNDTYEQVAKLVGHMAKKLGEYKVEEGTRFANTLVGNLRDLVKLLPAFNLTGDERLTALTTRIEKELCVEDAKTLREDDSVRESVKKSAEEILADVEKIMA